VTTLDSRSLGYTNTFGRSFREPGSVRYRLAGAAFACGIRDELPFAIEVADGGGEPAQHDVTVRQEGGDLVADPRELSIAAGDFVLWHSARATPGYTVQGDGAGGAFDSSALTEQTLYTHAFGLPGEYRWVDANRRSVSGVVTVTTLDSDVREECDKWTASLAEGTLVTIDGDRPDPPEVTILAGQTVFFAVTRGDGITVTDDRLLPQG
jgi:plastocyanin